MTCITSWMDQALVAFYIAWLANAIGAKNTPTWILLRLKRFAYGLCRGAKMLIS